MSDSRKIPILDADGNLIPIPLVYPSLSGLDLSVYTNVLLIDSAVKDYQDFVTYANAQTFPIVFSFSSTREELLTLLTTAGFSNLSRIGLVSETNDNGRVFPFLNGELLFTDSDSNGLSPFSNNMSFVVSLIQTLGITNIDFLACSTLLFSNWKNYYAVLLAQTGVTVGASDDKSGNIKYGGDWVLESTGQDVESLYFTSGIEYYQYLLLNAYINGNTVSVNTTVTTSSINTAINTIVYCISDNIDNFTNNAVLLGGGGASATPYGNDGAHAVIINANKTVTNLRNNGSLTGGGGQGGFGGNQGGAGGGGAASVANGDATYGAGGGGNFNNTGVYNAGGAGGKFGGNGAANGGGGGGFGGGGGGGGGGGTVAGNPGSGTNGTDGNSSGVGGNGGNGGTGGGTGGTGGNSGVFGSSTVTGYGGGGGGGAGANGGINTTNYKGGGGGGGGANSTYIFGGKAGEYCGAGGAGGGNGAYGGGGSGGGIDALGYGGSGGSGIRNNGIITNLYNSQNLSGNYGPLYIVGNSPLNYFITIQGDASYGQLFASRNTGMGPTGNVVFGIDSSSNFTAGTKVYTNVLSKVTPSNTSGSGTINGSVNVINYTWRLFQNTITVDKNTLAVVNYDLSLVSVLTPVVVPVTKVACVLEGTEVWTDKGMVAIENLKVGDSIRTRHYQIAITKIGKWSIDLNTEQDRDDLSKKMYKIAAGKYGTERDVYISHYHRVLVDENPDSDEESRVFRLPTSLGLPVADPREYSKDGKYTLYHLQLAVGNHYVVNGDCMVESWKSSDKYF